MKTDQFDEAFRRKLLGLPQTSTPGDVDRIHQYVVANPPPATGLGWYRAGYLAGGLLMVGSLVYNLVQHQTTTRLEAKLTALNSHAARIAPTLYSATPEQLTIRTDTVYIVRYRDGGTQPANPVVLPVGDQLESPQQPGVATSKGSETVGDKGAEPGLAVADSASETRQMASQSMANEPPALPNHSASNPLLTTPTRSLANQPTNPFFAKKNGATLAKRRDATSLDITLINPRQPTVNANSAEPATETIVAASGRAMSVAAIPSAAQTSAERQETATTIPVALRINPLLIRQSEPAETIDLLTRRVVFRSSFPSAVRLVQATAQPRESASSRVKGPYFFGIGADVTIQQLSASVLGEWRLRPLWSVQAGVKLTAVSGYQYYTADQFRDREGTDFRTQYAPYVPPTDDLLNIAQTYRLLQIPLTVAYHHPLGRAWSLRLGVGTDLTVYAQQHITFDYKETTSSFEQGLYEATITRPLVNNLTGSLGLERVQKRWLLRASTLFDVRSDLAGFQQDELNWGGTIQVLYRLRK